MRVFMTPPPEVSRDIGIAAGGFFLDYKLNYESPISIASGVRFWETNHIGYLTYICGGVGVMNATIGRYCSIAENVFIGGAQHPMDRISTHPFIASDVDEIANNPFPHFPEYRRLVDESHIITNADIPRTTIGNDVWIGRNALIMAGVTIGDGAVIGSHAVVTRDVPPYTISAGVPAHPIKKRFDDTMIEKLLAIKWWDYDIAKLKEKAGYSDVALFVATLQNMIEENEIAPMSFIRHSLENIDGTLSFIRHANGKIAR